MDRLVTEKRGIKTSTRVVRLIFSLVLISFLIYYGIHLNVESKNLQQQLKVQSDKILGLEKEIYKAKNSIDKMQNERSQVNTTESFTDSLNRNDFIDKNADVSKIKISGKSATNTGYSYSIAFTIQNGDTIAHSIHMSVIYYNKNNEPIITDGINIGTINPGQIKSSSFEQIKNFGLINTYKLIVEENKK